MVHMLFFKHTYVQYIRMLYRIIPNEIFHTVVPQLTRL